MGATANKQALRGGSSIPELDTADFSEPAADDEMGEPEAFDDDATASGDEPLPEHCHEEDGTGDWIYELQHPLSDGTRVPARIRIPREIYARDVRNASRGTTQAETVFYMLASCARIAPRILDKVHAEDYMILAVLMNRRAAKNSRAVLRSLGQGR